MLSLTLSVGLFIVNPIIAEAGGTNSYVVRFTAEGDLIISTIDIKGVITEPRYHTIGITISRNVYGTDERAGGDQYVELTLAQASGIMTTSIGSAGQRLRTEYTYSWSSISNAIQSKFPDWYAEIEQAKANGDYYSMYYDSVMVEVPIGVEGGNLTQSDDWSGAYQNWFNAEAGKYPFGSCYVKSDMPLHSGEYHYDPDLLTLHSWTNPSDIRGHYDILLPLFDEQEKPQEIEPLETSIYNIGSPLANLKFGTKNWSDEFDVGVAIPSSEYIHNAIEYDDWYGVTAISNMKKSRLYKIPVNVSWHETYSVEIEEFVGGVWQKDWESVTYDYSRAYVFNVTREAYYHYVANASLWLEHSAEVDNGVYPNGAIHYGGEAELEYRFVIDGQENPELAKGQGTEATHVQWLNLDAEGVTHNVDIGECKDAPLIKAKQAGKAYAEGLIKAPRVKNDYVEMDGKVYMDGKWYDGGVAPKPFTEGQTTEMVFNGVKYYVPEIHQTGKTTEVQIPPETANGKYDTSMKIKYQQIYAPTMSVITHTKHGLDCILEGWEHNEPVYVHTPVISPVSIINPSTGARLTSADMTNQLVHGAICHDVDYQLRLDKEYTVKFDPDTHREIQGYGWSGDPSKYDKYVAKKEVRFPFSVEMYGDFYEIGADGYTEWIEIEDLRQFSFYVSSWAREGVYGVSPASGGDYIYATDRMIEVKVTSINAEPNGMEDLVEYEKNTTTIDNIGIFYVANYYMSVQISGHIYGMEIVGISDGFTFGGEDYKDAEMYPFAYNKEEHKSGIYNRIGGLNVRFTKDDTFAIPQWNPRDTLPMTTGKSKIFKSMGWLKQGYSFSFTLETISNLTGLDDEVVITPNFRFIANDGTVQNVDVYYKPDTESAYVKIGSDESKVLNRKTSINSQWFKSTYKQGDIDFTLSTNEAMRLAEGRMDMYPWKTIQRFTADEYVFNYGQIRMGNVQKIFDGTEMRLERFLATPIESMPTLSLTPYQRDEFHKSMQKWYGKYALPNKLFVVDEGTNLYDYIVEKAKDEGGMKESDDIFKRDGYLVVGFDITTYKDGKPYMKYGSSSDNMWATETGNAEGTVTYINEIDGTPIVGYEYKYGDIGVIDLNKDILDGYRVGVLFIR